MPKPEGETMYARSAIPAGEQPEGDQAAALRERAVGEPPYPQPAAGLTTTLRPQQSRNVVWRWQLRRRPRAR
jgi:hypothetical protein